MLSTHFPCKCVETWVGLAGMDGSIQKENYLSTYELFTKGTGRLLRQQILMLIIQPNIYADMKPMKLSHGGSELILSSLILNVQCFALIGLYFFYINENDLFCRTVDKDEKPEGNGPSEE